LNKAILDIEPQEYIQKNLHSDIVRISLAKSPFPAISPKELAQQIDGRRRCESKLPLWYNTTGIYYPEKIALEQCSSEATAKYKASLISGNEVTDLTGGFGVDSCFFSLTAAKVTHCELNAELSEISSYNSRFLGFNVNHLHIDGIKHLRESQNGEGTVYIDPSRRVSSRKVFMLKDCVPDVVSELDLLRERSARVIIKTAPLLDIHSTIKELGAVSGVHVLSIKNECKEVVYLIDRSSSETDPPITCAIPDAEKVRTFTFRTSAEKDYILHDYSKPLEFLYEPDVSLLKAGCFKLITKEFNVRKLNQHTHIYTSDTLRDSFMGRRFSVQNTWDYGSFIKQHTFNKANIISRNFPQDPDQIKKKLRINDGGNDYLLFCTGPNNELLVIHCYRLP
jgi:hypothetical protein